MNTAINELKQMSEKERILWLVNAKSSDLTLVLKNAGIKGISKMNKDEKMSMILDLAVENIPDEEVDKVVDDTRELYKELKIRQSFEETLKNTLYARYKNNEITYNQLRKVCNKYHFDIPLSYNEESSTDLVDRYCDMYSNYVHYDEKGKIYFSVLDRDYDWHNVHKNSYECRDYNWNGQQLYKHNTVDNGVQQLAFTFEDNEYVMLCVYKNYKLLATYVWGNMDDLVKLVAYDNKLSDEDLKAYEELLKLLADKYEEYDKILDADMKLQRKLNKVEKYRQFITEKLV